MRDVFNSKPKSQQAASRVRVQRPELPQELADILDKTLSKSPAQRYQTGGELAADLHAVQSARQHVCPDRAGR